MKNMKKLLPALLLFAACTRDNASVTEYYPASLIGSWSNNVPTNRAVSFTKDIATWDNLTTNKYRVSHDTEYIVYDKKGIPDDPQFTFKFTDNNNTLITYQIVDKSTITYKRVNTRQ